MTDDADLRYTKVIAKYGDRKPESVEYVRHGDIALVNEMLLKSMAERIAIKSALERKRQTADGITSDEYRLLRAVTLTTQKISKNTE